MVFLSFLSNPIAPVDDAIAHEDVAATAAQQDVQPTSTPQDVVTLVAGQSVGSIRTPDFVIPRSTLCAVLFVQIQPLCLAQAVRRKHQAMIDAPGLGRAVKTGRAGMELFQAM